MHCISRGGSCLVNCYCEVQEDNLWRKESYNACWLDVLLETRPQYRMTLSENDSLQRESYQQQQVVHLMVERNPGQTLKLGTDRGNMTKYQLPVFVRNGNLRGDGEDVSAITQDLCKPERENFRASRLMSPPRGSSH